MNRTLDMLVQSAQIFYEKQVRKHSAIVVRIRLAVRCDLDVSIQ
jgi:hypothetical protein